MIEDYTDFEWDDLLWRIFRRQSILYTLEDINKN
jgi:hypothetical protein